jgi:hypothetical protein
MKPRVSAPLLLVLLLAFGHTTYANPKLDSLAHQSISSDAKEAETAISKLRATGPAGLDALFRVHAGEISRQASDPLLAATVEWKRLSAALDAVSQQKDSYLSGLYWHTDFAAAKAAASATGKPILSLRLLGKLSEEFSCANSRFFRTVLYSNAAVSKVLRERYVLHWQSVRPAPRVTIDFGDGRKLERTLTGNSIHYVLNTDGSLIDGLPGLYGPRTFLRSLTQFEEVFKQLHKPAGNTPSSYVLASHHRARVNAINVAWVSDIQAIGGKIPEDIRVVRNAEGAPAAIEITSLAITKAMTERTILRNITAGPEALAEVMDEEAWRKIAAFHRADAQLDARSLSLIRRQTKSVLGDGDSNREKDFASLVQRLENNIALDTVRNEYLLHSKLLAWLMTDRGRSDVEVLNKKVYAELFLTPASDPWLGLFSSDTYLALENGGLVR